MDRYLKYTGCPTILAPLCFLLFYYTKIQKLGENQEICYMIGTRILKIDLEIAEIIEVKVGNHYFEIYILLYREAEK